MLRTNESRPSILQAHGRQSLLKLRNVPTATRRPRSSLAWQREQHALDDGQGGRGEGEAPPRYLQRNGAKAMTCTSTVPKAMKLGNGRLEARSMR